MEKQDLILVEEEKERDKAKILKRKAELQKREEALKAKQAE